MSLLLAFSLVLAASPSFAQDRRPPREVQGARVRARRGGDEGHRGEGRRTAPLRRRGEDRPGRYGASAPRRPRRGPHSRKLGVPAPRQYPQYDPALHVRGVPDRPAPRKLEGGETFKESARPPRSPRRARHAVLGKDPTEKKTSTYRRLRPYRDRRHGERQDGPGPRQQRDDDGSVGRGSGGRQAASRSRRPTSIISGSRARFRTWSPSIDLPETLGAMAWKGVGHWTLARRRSRRYDHPMDKIAFLRERVPLFVGVNDENLAALARNPPF